MHIRKILALSGIIVIILTGCNNKGKSTLKPIIIEQYERTTYESVEAVQGDITPIISLKVSPSDMRHVSYYPTKDEMEVDQVFVKAGDSVEAGDVMVTFKSDDVQEKIREYEDKLAQAQLLLEHYEKLSKINPETDYSADIEQLKNDINVNAMYVEEQNAILRSYTIVAEDSGVVNSVSDLLYYGIVNSYDSVITVMYGDGEYYATTDDSYPYEVGSIYNMTSYTGNYDMELVDIVEEGSVKTLKFRAYNTDQKLTVKGLDLVIEKETLKNVIYIPDKCIFEVNKKHYVYIINEDGFRTGHEVEIGDTIDGYTVIKSGVNAGDKVVILK